MRLGALFPTSEIGTDPGAIRDYVQALEALGYDHVAIFDHVLGVDLAGRKDQETQRYFSREWQMHEPLVLYGYLAACTQRLELATSILIAPQRQAALLAKQAVEVDILSGGRFRLGIGLGWHQPEYEALGVDFRVRGRLLEEQVAVLRALWTQEVVTFQGQWHHITEAGINPLPVRRSIPLWIGGSAEPALRRVARLADGWFPQMRPDDQGREVLERLRGYAREAGRDPSTLGIEARINAARGTPEDWAQGYAAWKDLGATHITASTIGGGFTPDGHIDVLRRFKEAVS